MQRTLRLALGIVTLVPALVLITSFAKMLSVFGRIAEAGGSVAPETLSRALAELSWLQGGAVILALVLLAFYLGHLLVRRAASSTGEKLLWVLLLVGAAVITMPVYWYLHFWCEDPQRRESVPLAARRARPSS